MLKYLLLMALAAAIWWHWRKSSQPSPELRRPEAPVQKMVACATCGLHLPENEAISEDGRHYCCASHRPAGKNVSHP